MLKNSVFDFKNYKEYLSFALELRAAHQKGQRSRLARFIGCNPAYLSQVLNGTVDLSPEQAQMTNVFLGHIPTEARYFLNLVLFERAGNKELRAYYNEELKRQNQERLTLKNRVQANRSLNETDQARYYSSWFYAAIHVAVSLPHLRTGEKIAEALSLPQKTVNQALEFLLQIGVLKQYGKELRQGEVNLYLGSDSNFIAKHHTNWRMKSIQSLDIVKDQDLHYSGVITCSEDDILKIKEFLIKAVESISGIVKNSKDESLYVYTIDLFGLLK